MLPCFVSMEREGMQLQVRRVCGADGERGHSCAGRARYVRVRTPDGGRKSGTVRGSTAGLIGCHWYHYTCSCSQELMVSQAAYCFFYKIRLLTVAESLKLKGPDVAVQPAKDWVLSMVNHEG
jgi:hypothetical protein